MVSTGSAALRRHDIVVHAVPTAGPRIAITRTLDAGPINAILNHPAVYPAVIGYGDGPIDLSPIVANPANVLLTGEQGCILFVEHQPGFYEAHTQVLPDGRGAWAVELVQAALHWMFTRTAAVEVQTRCPVGNLPALALARRVGGKFVFRNPRGWVLDRKQVPADIYALSIADWISTAPGLERVGHWFHEKLEAEYRRLGAADPAPHPDDEVHDRYVGAAVEMIRGEMPYKAAVFYNRWAVMADYAAIQILKDSPPYSVDIQDAILIVRPDGDFWVATCRKPGRKDLH